MEMPPQQPTSYGKAIRDNSNYTDATVISIRLDTKIIVDDLRVFLSGQMEIVEPDENNQLVTKIVQMGERKCNDAGMQAILSFISAIINPQVVQGNYLIEQYKAHCFFIRNELTKMVIVNLYVWEIQEKEMESIIDTVMNTIEPFLTRLIDNEERKSYSQSMQVSESATYGQERSGGLFGLFGGRR